jgi:hypothetical protein
MSTKKQRMYENIEKHGKDLINFFGLPEDTDAIKLCKRLFRIEKKAHHATTCLCNTNTLDLLELNQYTGYDVIQATEEEQDAFFDGIERALSKIIGADNLKKCFINHDPRGYALKIRSEDAKDAKIHKDWGGYGIIAPDFNE